MGALSGFAEGFNTNSMMYGAQMSAVRRAKAKEEEAKAGDVKVSDALAFLMGGQKSEAGGKVAEAAEQSKAAFEDAVSPSVDANTLDPKGIATAASAAPTGIPPMPPAQALVGGTPPAQQGPAAAPSQAAALDQPISNGEQFRTQYREAVATVFEVYAGRGEMAKAFETIDSMERHVDQQVKKGLKGALRAMKLGKVDEAANAITSAYDLIPDGGDMQVQRDEAGDPIVFLRGEDSEVAGGEKLTVEFIENLILQEEDLFQYRTLTADEKHKDALRKHNAEKLGIDKDRLEMDKDAAKYAKSIGQVDTWFKWMGLQLQQEEAASNIKLNEARIGNLDADAALSNSYAQGGGKPLTSGDKIRLRNNADSAITTMVSAQAFSPEQEDMLFPKEGDESIRPALTNYIANLPDTVEGKGSPQAAILQAMESLKGESPERIVWTLQVAAQYGITVEQLFQVLQQQAGQGALAP